MPCLPTCMQTCASDDARADGLGGAPRTIMKDYLDTEPELAAKMSADELLEHFSKLVQHFGGPALA